MPYYFNVMNALPNSKVWKLPQYYSLGYLPANFSITEIVHYWLCVTILEFDRTQILSPY